MCLRVVSTGDRSRDRKRQANTVIEGRLEGFAHSLLAPESATVENWRFDPSRKIRRSQGEASLDVRTGEGGPA